MLIILAISWSNVTVFADQDPSFICPGLLVEVDSGSNQDQALICAAVDRARAFFQQHGIQIKRPIRIQLHQTEILNHANHIGLYDVRQDRIDLLTLEQTKSLCKEQSPFGIQMSEPLYQSFVIHEVAHAIADQNFSKKPSSLIVQEYLSYVAQLATMDPLMQTEVLQQYDVTAFSGLEDMSLTYYYLAPNAFGVKAFLHYQSVKDQDSFIQGLISGAIQPNSTQTEWW